MNSKILFLGLFLIQACNQIQPDNIQSDNNSDQTVFFEEGNPSEEGDGFAGDTEDQDTDVSQVTVSSASLLTEDNLTQVFSARYPVASSLFNIISPFGPRLQYGQDNRYDFHRGIDIHGTEGDSIYAVASGTLYKAYRDGSSSYPNGGNVVVLQHNLNQAIYFHGKKVTKLYTLYLHLKSFGPAATTYLNTGKTSAVAAGDLVGLMGHTGNAVADHLHFEVRLQTTCSLEYQLANPTSSCASYGFDPHIDPLPLFEKEAGNYQLSVVEILPDLVTLKATADHNHADINSLEISVYSDASKTKLLDSFDIDYNARTGFDASSTASLDNPDLGDLTILPYSFHSPDGNEEVDFYYSLDTTLKAQYPDLTLNAVLFNAQGENVGDVSTKIVY